MVLHRFTFLGFRSSHLGALIVSLCPYVHPLLTLKTVNTKDETVRVYLSRCQSAKMKSTTYFCNTSLT